LKPKKQSLTRENGRTDIKITILNKKRSYAKNIINELNNILTCVTGHKNKFYIGCKEY